MSNTQKTQIRGQKGRGLGHVTYSLILGLPLYISRTAKDRNLKFDVQIDYCEYYSKHAKLKDRRAVA